MTSQTVLPALTEEAWVLKEKLPLVLNCPSLYSFLLAISNFRVLIYSTKLLQFELFRTRQTAI